MPGRLTTHVLDTAAGRPATSLRIELDAIGADGARERLVATATNADGRCDRPLLEGAAMRRGVFELRFHAGDHFRACGVALADPAFLDVVVIRFGIGDAGAHYHVPLLISPYGYSTYRGS